jgi:hypothetical protein
MALSESRDLWRSSAKSSPVSWSRMDSPCVTQMTTSSFQVRKGTTTRCVLPANEQLLAWIEQNSLRVMIDTMPSDLGLIGSSGNDQIRLHVVFAENTPCFNQLHCWQFFDSGSMISLKTAPQNSLSFQSWKRDSPPMIPRTQCETALS